jgi:polyphosphate kinase
MTPPNAEAPEATARAAAPLQAGPAEASPAPRAEAPASETEPLRKPASVTPIKPPAAPDLSSPEHYLNRELTWLAFNRRVLHEAEDERTPLLERIKFLAIVSSNLDEFFMKRIGGLKRQVEVGMRERTVDGRTPQEQIDACYPVIRELEQRKWKLLLGLVKRLRRQGVVLARYEQLEEDDRKALREHYFRNVFPLVTPQAMDPAHPFPFVSNLSLNLLVSLHHPKDQSPLLARVKVPVGGGIPRFLRVGDRKLMTPLEEVMAHNLDLLFPGMEIDGCEVFRVIRNAQAEREEEQADDLLALIETELRERKFAPIVRLEVSPGMDPVRRGMLAAELELDEATEVVELEGLLGMKDLWEVANLDEPELLDAPHRPAEHPDLVSDRNVFHIIRDAGAILLHHPYHSFPSTVERFLREASEDPKVRAIKMTLYRTSAESQVIDHLIAAARNGKQVAVVVELKARFDEGSNIHWASRLEDVGIHVTYGVVGLKTHCKVILVVRQDYNRLRRYAHVGTGNYHSGTARIYSDLGLLTCDDEIGQDLTELFNYLTTGYKPKRSYKRILPAPALLKTALLEKIEREIRHQAAGWPGLIQMKMNALEDADLVRALYRASQAGVHVDLIVRDTCRLRPGIPGLSENIQVVSIVGRFLEHPRVLYFHNGGKPEYFIGSADCMKRNLESRVEVLVPIEDPRLQGELRFLLDCQLRDARSAWDMRPDGSYAQRRPGRGAKRVGCQQILIQRAEKQLRDATRLRKRKLQGIARRSPR